ncbi:MAG: lysophospholipid acyltransferase family protein [Candidatus Hydrogenedentes bacterium]|nr:lysophospholipid acyltransferase family protein [Candidatus Hydrogenedentota bacterium]
MGKQHIIETATQPLLQLTVRIVGAMPVPLLRVLGSAIGHVLYLVARGRRRIAMANLDIVYGDSLSRRAKQRIARLSGINFLQDILVLIHGYRLPLNKLEQLVDGSNVAAIKKLVDEGHGVIIVSGHISNFPLVVSYLARHGIPIATFVRKSGFRPTGRVMENMQAAAGVTTLDRDRTPIEARTWLKRGGVLWLTIDQNARHGVLVDFFGKPATTYPLAVRMARAGGTPILPAFVHTNDAGTYVLEIESPIRLPRGKPTHEELVSTLRYLTELLEQHILRTPEQWLWPHRRWRSAEKILRKQAVNHTENG